MVSPLDLLPRFDNLMARPSFGAVVLLLGSVTQAFVCPASCPSTPAGLVIGLRPTVGSRKVMPTLQAIDGTDPSGGRWGGRWERSLGRRGKGLIVWREATKNFASKAVQRQQGEELLRVSGKLDILLLLCAFTVSLQVVLLGQSLGFLLGLPLTGQ